MTQLIWYGSLFDVGSYSKDLGQVLKDYVSFGYRIERGRHAKVYDGGRLVAVLPVSTGGGRGIQNARAQQKRVLRAAGKAA